MSLPRMSLHIGDYRKDTGHLRAAGHGAYLLLIMHYWTKGGLPDDDKQLAAIACMSPREWRDVKPILQAFFHDGWKHGRIDEELARAEATYQRRADAGRKGGIAQAGLKPGLSITQAGLKHDDATAGLKQPITDNQERVDDGGEDARARDPLISREALSFTERIHAAMGWEIDDPRAIGSAYIAQKWLSSGWNADLCVTAIQRVVASSRKSINSLTYFEKPIAEAHAEQTRPVPVAIVNQTAEVVHVRTQADRHGTAKSGITNAIDSLIERLSDTQPGSGAGSQNPPRLLSSG